MKATESQRQLNNMKKTIKAMKAQTKKRELHQMLGRTQRNNIAVYMSGSFGRSFSNRRRSSSATSSISQSGKRKQNIRADSAMNSNHNAKEGGNNTSFQISETIRTS